MELGVGWVPGGRSGSCRLRAEERGRERTASCERCESEQCESERVDWQMLLHKPLGTEFPYVKDIVPGTAAPIVRRARFEMSGTDAAHGAAKVGLQTATGGSRRERSYWPSTKRRCVLPQVNGLTSN
eukprot:899740-Rhodomonas_salina.2